MYHKDKMSCINMFPEPHNGCLCVNSLTTKTTLHLKTNKNKTKKQRKNRAWKIHDSFIEFPLFQPSPQRESRWSVTTLDPMNTVSQNPVEQSDSIRRNSTTFRRFTSAVAIYSVSLPLFLFPYHFTLLSFLIHAFFKSDFLRSLLRIHLSLPFLFLWEQKKQQQTI